MRWFKHLSTASEDEKLSEIMELHGPEGIGVYWIILEKIAFLMDKSDNTKARYSVKKWAKFCGKSPKVFRKFLESFQELSLFKIEICEKNSDFLIIECRNLLKYRDEYSKKSGQYQDNDKIKSGASQEQETETETETETEKKTHRFSDDSIEMKICKYFFAVLKKSNPNQQKPNFQNWCDHVEKLIRINKADPADIKKVINYAHDPANSTSKFSWIPNLRSTKKLREHFEKIFVQMQQNFTTKQKSKAHEYLDSILSESNENEIILTGEDYGEI